MPTTAELQLTFKGYRYLIRIKEVKSTYGPDEYLLDLSGKDEFSKTVFIPTYKGVHDKVYNQVWVITLGFKAEFTTKFVRMVKSEPYSPVLHVFQTGMDHVRRAFTTKKKKNTDSNSISVKSNVESLSELPRSTCAK